MRIALGIEYNGTGFNGWQRQHNVPTIQGKLEEALSKVANEKIEIFCAGRTDAGVHATGQVVHFDTRAKRHIDAWIFGVNISLHPSIAVRWSRAVDYHFHARFRATSRRYVYVIYNNPVRPALLNTRVSWHYYPLDIELMRLASLCLIGEHDFNSFRSTQCNSKTSVRKVNEISFTRQGDYIFIEIEANAFLHHMVRNIVGSLMKVGSGRREIAWMEQVLQAKSRKVAAETAPPDGLYLTQVKYPQIYNFPLTDVPFLL